MIDERKNLVGLKMSLRKISNYKTKGREMDNARYKEKQAINPRSLVSD